MFCAMYFAFTMIYLSFKLFDYKVHPPSRKVNKKNTTEKQKLLKALLEPLLARKSELKV